MGATGNNIVSHFVNAAVQFPNRVAIIDKSCEISYSELLKKVKQKASYFSEKGIKENDRVLVFIPMSVDLYITVLALFYIGAVAVFIDEWVNKKRLALCCEIASCKAFIAPFYLRLLACSMKTLRKIPIWLKAGSSSVKMMNSNQPVENSQTALITFTTGSTGIPKAANRTHAFLNAQFNALKTEINPVATDIDLPVLPIVLLMNLGIGCTSVISTFKAAKPWKTNYESITTLILSKKINRIESSPDFVIRLAEYCIKNKIQVDGIKKIFTGGAPVFPYQANLLVQAFPHAEINVVYGSTEAEPISLISAQLLKNAKQSLANGLLVGEVSACAKVFILPVKTGEYVITSKQDLITMQCKPNTIGEIVVTGEHVLQSYINNPEAIKENKIFIDGICYHRTGDSGYLDEHGSLYLTGRASMLIYKDGKVIAPFIYENAIIETGICKCGTVVAINELITIVIEGTPVESEKVELAIKSKGLYFDRCIAMKKIPRDKRHHSKIEYTILRDAIGKRI